MTHSLRSVAGLLIVGMLTGAPSPASAADFSSWTRTMSFRFAGYNPPGGATTLTNFPALVVLSTNLAGFLYTDFNGTNADLRFTDATATNELNYQVEKWDTNGSSYVWVQVPQLANTLSQVLAFWGKSGQTKPAYTTNGATWSEGYLAVWHMSETSALDSTSNGYHGGSFGNTNATGVADGAQGFSSTSTYVVIPPASSANAITVEAWVKHATLPVTVQRYVSLSSEAAVFRHAGSGSLHFYMVTDPSATYAPLTVAGALVIGEWYHVVGTWDGTNQRLYKNGSNLANATPSGTLRAFSGGQLSLNAGEPMDGLMDEVRLSTVARSSNWVWASWMNMASNSAFVTNGALQNPADPRPVNVTAPSEGVTSDQFDVAQGAKVFGFSTTLTNYFPLISDARDSLGLTRSSPALESGHTIFLDGSVGTIRAINFRTATHINLTNYQLRVTSDPGSNRTIGYFALFGSADNMTYTRIASNSITVPYNTNPNVTTLGIMVSGTVNTPAFQFFSLQIAHGFTDGPRVVELDGFGPAAVFEGTVRDPIVFNSTQNAASTNTYLDQDPGYATNLTTSTLNIGYTLNSGGKYALGAVGAPESPNLVFTDGGNVKDNGDLIFGNGGETIHQIAWDSTQYLRLSGINISISSPDRPSRLLRFSVNGVAQVFANSGSNVLNVAGINSGGTNFLFASPVGGTSFKLELTGGTNSDGIAYGPRLAEIDALLYYLPRCTLLNFR